MALFKQVPEERLEWTGQYRTGQYQLTAGDHLYAEGEDHDLVYTLVVLQYRPENSVFQAQSLPITQEDLADAVGITPIHANRVLKQMREEGLLSCGKKQIAILDEAALKQIGHFDPKLVEDAQMF